MIDDLVLLKSALFALRPNAKWHFGEDCTIVWLDEKQTEPTDKEINDWIKATQYQRDRSVAYDPISEQLDQIYHDIDGWKAKVKAVKDKYPKPSE